MLFEKRDKEITEQELEQIKDRAGCMVQMFDDKIADPQKRLALVAALAGYACHKAVMKETDMTLVMVELKDGRTFYYGDDLNFFLLENKYSVYSFIKGYLDVAMGRPADLDVKRIVAEQTETLGKLDKKLCDVYFPDGLYREMKECWDGIFENMTAKICTSSRQWPVLFSVVLQVVMRHMEGDPVKKSVQALQTAIYISKMDEKSLIESSEKLKKDTEKQLYSFLQKGEIIPLDTPSETFIRRSIDMLRAFFKENEMEFNVSSRIEDMVKILGTKMRIHDEPVDIYISLYAKTKVAAIDFICPFKADMFRLNELCQTLVKLNSGRLTGMFRLDPNDGMLSNTVAFPCHEGLTRDDFLMAFIPNMKALSDKMEILKSFAR